MVLTGLLREAVARGTVDRQMRLVPWLLASLVLGFARPTFADEPTYHAVIDNVTLEPSSLGGQRLRVSVSMISFEGKVIDAPEAASIKLVVNGGKLDAPLGIGTFGATAGDLAIVFVVQTSLGFTDVLPVVASALDDAVLAVASERTQIAILTYGESLGSGKFGGAKSARGKILAIASDGSVGEPLLLDTLERALVLLKKAKTKPEGRPLRKMIVAISDGRDASSDRERVVRIATRAAKEDVRIHAFAYSPKDVRRPLLLLGELSKRSLGTFRWIRGGKADSWIPAFEQLQTEIAKQLVLTFYLASDDDVAGKKLRIATTGRAEVISLNEHKIPVAGCAGEPCDPGTYCTGERCVAPRPPHRRGVLGWIAMIGAIGLGAIVALGSIGFMMSKRQQAAARRAAMPPGGIAAVRKAKPSRAPPQVALPIQPVGARPRVQVLSGPRTGEELALKHGFFFGKAPGCDLLLDDGHTSGHHAQVTMDPAGICVLHDYGSTNGTFVNGVRITNVTLEHGATIRIGSTEFRFLAQ